MTSTSRHQLWRPLFVAVCLFGQWASSLAMAEKPAKLSSAQIGRLTLDGDRLADQGDFQGALNKYTQAYLGVVSGIRGQEFVQSVLPSIYNREELGEEMLRIMKEEYSDAEIELMESSFKVFGLVANDADCQQMITQLLTEEVAGFYDPDGKRMVLIVEDGPVKDPGWFGRLLGAKPAFDKAEQKTTLAHELTHALQDQLYDLNAMEAGIEKDDDMLLAFSALVEGDATLLMFAEADGGSQDITEMDPAAMRATFNIMSWMMPLAGGEAYRKAPPIFRESLIFPYLQGMLFVLDQAADKGWAGVHACYASPPLSTEQILHPEKYAPGEQYDAPQSVSLPEVSDVLDSDWKQLGGNCLGELQTRILLGRVHGGSLAARGWDGDRYEVFRHAAGKLALVSVSVWDSPRDAEEFATAYRRYRGIEGGDQPEPPLSEQTETEQTDSDAAQLAPSTQGPDASVSRADTGAAQAFLSKIPSAESSVFSDGAWRAMLIDQDRVRVVEGFDKQTTAAVIERLGESTFAAKPFPLPGAAGIPLE